MFWFMAYRTRNNCICSVLNDLKTGGEVTETKWLGGEMTVKRCESEVPEWEGLSLLATF